MLSESTVRIVQEITPLVAANSETITRKFYKQMFHANPEVKPFFNAANQHSGGQQRALAGAICAYFTHIDNPGVLQPAIELIAQKHCSLSITPDQYPIVGSNLLWAIREVMGTAATEEIMDAVADAYGFLADLLIEREGAIYEEQASMPGGWRGTRTFVIARRVAESETVTSFYLKPQDGGALPQFKPGQYITVHMDLADKTSTMRNYSLSDRPGQPHFRISVQREASRAENAPDGVVSNYLLDKLGEGNTVKLGPPCGEFTIEAASVKAPIVLLAGGIGATPLMSMAHAILAANSNATIYFLQAARNSKVRVFQQELRDAAKVGPNVTTKVIFDDPLPGDVENGHCDEVGFVTRDLIDDWTPVSEAHYYFCGPKPFMQNIYAHLQALGVEESRIRFEFFGPKAELSPAAATSTSDHQT